MARSFDWSVLGMGVAEAEAAPFANGCLISWFLARPLAGTAQRTAYSEGTPLLHLALLRKIPRSHHSVCNCTLDIHFPCCSLLNASDVFSERKRRIFQSPAILWRFR